MADIEQVTYRQPYLETLPLSELAVLSDKLRGEVIDLLPHIGECGKGEKQ